MLSLTGDLGLSRSYPVGCKVVTQRTLTPLPWHGELMRATVVHSTPIKVKGTKITVWHLTIQEPTGERHLRNNLQVCRDDEEVLHSLETHSTPFERFCGALLLGATDSVLRREAKDLVSDQDLLYVELLRGYDIPSMYIAPFVLSMCLEEDGERHRKMFWQDGEVMKLFTPHGLAEAVKALCKVDPMGTFTDPNMFRVEEYLKSCGFSAAKVRENMAEIEAVAAAELPAMSEFRFDLVEQVSSRFLPNLAASAPVLHGWGLVTLGMALAYDNRLLTKIVTSRLREVFEQHPTIGALIYRYIAEGFRRYRPDVWETLLRESGLSLFLRFHGWELRTLTKDVKGELYADLSDMPGVTFIHEGGGLSEGDLVLVSHLQMQDDAAKKVGTASVYRMPLMPAQPATGEMLQNWRDYLP